MHVHFLTFSNTRICQNYTLSNIYERILDICGTHPWPLNFCRVIKAPQGKILIFLKLNVTIFGAVMAKNDFDILASMTELWSFNFRHMTRWYSLPVLAAKRPPTLACCKSVSAWNKVDQGAVSLANLDSDLDLATSVPFGAYGASTVTRSTLWPWRVHHHVQHSTDKLQHQCVSNLHSASHSWQHVVDQFAVRLAGTCRTCLQTSTVPARRRFFYTPFSHCGRQRRLCESERSSGEDGQEDQNLDR